MQIWDTAGQERYRTITKAYYKGADGILVVFDLTDRESFNNIDNWLNEIETHCGTDINIMVLANKADLADHHMRDEDEKDIEVTDQDI